MELRTCEREYEQGLVNNLNLHRIHVLNIGARLRRPFPPSSIFVFSQDREIAELKEEALRWSANDTRLRQMNQQLVTETMQLRHIIEQSLPPNPS